MKSTARPRKKTATSPKTQVKPKILTAETDHNGYTAFILSEGSGGSRRFWWHCSGCWEHSADEPLLDEEDAQWELFAHAALCPGYVHQARIQIVWADGHPITTVRI